MPRKTVLMLVAVGVPPTMTARRAMREVRELLTEARRRFETEMTCRKITAPPFKELARLDRLEEAATALLDSTPDPADWQAPWMRQLSQAVAGEPIEGRPGAKQATCEACEEGPFMIDGSDPDVDSTWQQWQCPCCQRWNDRETDPA